METILQATYAIAAITLPDLPYANNALEPYISSQTLDVHHGLHHKTYADNLAKLLKDQKKYDGLSLGEIVLQSYSNNDKAVFNNAAQVFNHNMQWLSLKPNTSKEPSKILKQYIDDSFGNIEAMKVSIKDNALSQFGSGWVWLVFDYKTNKLQIVKTSNADNPITDDMVPLWNIDVWEHSYYIDYRNKRAAYVDAVLENLFNLEFASVNLTHALKTYNLL